MSIIKFCLPFSPFYLFLLLLHVLPSIETRIYTITHLHIVSQFIKTEVLKILPVPPAVNFPFLPSLFQHGSSHDDVFSFPRSKSARGTVWDIKRTIGSLYSLLWEKGRGRRCISLHLSSPIGIEIEWSLYLPVFEDIPDLDCCIAPRRNSKSPSLQRHKRQCSLFFLNLARVII